jgi:hypothetical protein
MRVKELKELIDKMILEGKGDYLVTGYNDHFAYGVNEKWDEATIEVNDKLERLEINVDK